MGEKKPKKDGNWASTLKDLQKLIAPPEKAPKKKFGGFAELKGSFCFNLSGTATGKTGIDRPATQDRPVSALNAPESMDISTVDDDGQSMSHKEYNIVAFLDFLMNRFGTLQDAYKTLDSNG